MKQYKTKIFLLAMLAGCPLLANAQTEADANEESAPKKVHVAFRDVDEDKLLGGVSFVDMEELRAKDYTTYSLDDLSALVGGWNGGNLWGMDGDNTDTNDNTGTLVLIDGVKRPANNILPSEIEQITFLKGAQAVVLYGPKAAKGAILITTKRATIDGLQVKVNANTGFHVAKAFPEYLSAPEYMQLYNEARVNDGNKPLYTDQDIYNHSTGSNPYRYPNINYYSDEYIRKMYNRSEATAEIQGGAERARFYTNISYYRHEDLLNFGNAKKNNTNRLSVRGNVDLRINKFISGYVNASATLYNNNHDRGNFWDDAAKMRPNFPQNAAPLIPISMIDPNATNALDILGKSINIIDGLYFPGGTKDNMSTEIAATYLKGKATDVSRQFQFDAGIHFDLNHLVKGLDFRTLFSIDYATAYQLYYDNKYSVFIPTWSNYNGKDVIVAISQPDDEIHTGNQSWGSGKNRQTITWNGHFNYDRMFGTDHHVTGILLANMFTTTSDGEYNRYTNANIGLQAGYDYKGLYFAEAGVAGVWSARLPEGNRGALSPTATLGWRLGKEKFMENTIVDDLMLSVSASDLNEDMDIIMGSKMYYLYDALWSQSGSSFGWNEDSSKPSTYSTQGVNYKLGYIHRKEFSFNLRGSFFNKFLTADVSFFTNKMDGYLIQNPTTFPSHLANNPQGTFKPVINHDANQRVGIDFSVKAQKQFGQVYAALGISGTYYDNKRVKVDEVQTESYQYRQGHPIDGIWGLECLGFFNSDEEIAAAPSQKLGSTVKPGDLRYKDQNGDGVIDNYDEVYLGKGGWYGAPLTYGVNLTLKWKGFTLFVLGTGNAGAYGIKGNSEEVSGTYYWPGVKQDYNKFSEVVRGRWTPATASTATYPRLTALGGQNNYRTSDFWMYSTDRFDIQKVQLTYDFPASVFATSFINGLSVYLSGHSLLTISKNRKHMETNIGSAPQTRFYNLGVQVTI